MGDLISRGAAIDALMEILDRPNHAEFLYTDEICRALNHLPSALSDGIPLEWIDKHLEWLDNCDNDFAQLAKVGIRAMVEIWKKDEI